MRAYVCFDDTDTVDADRGTGKLARWFENELPEGCSLWGVVRQQLLVHDEIPYTSHNSSACAVIDIPGRDILIELKTRAVQHIEKHFISGSDPGLCVACEGDKALEHLMAFGKSCAACIMTQQQAMDAACGAHLSGHGGSNDGIIGAAAGAGLTAWGWAGRFIEFGRLRDFTSLASVAALTYAGIQVVSLDRDAKIPASDDMVDTKAWLRPRLWGAQAVLPVIFKQEGLWEGINEKRRNNT